MELKLNIYPISKGPDKNKYCVEFYIDSEIIQKIKMDDLVVHSLFETLKDKFTKQVKNLEK